MREKTLEKEVEQLRAELAQARALIAELRAELDRLQNERTTPPPFVKPNTPKAKSHATKQPRRKRAKEQNGARKRDTPTQTIQHKWISAPLVLTRYAMLVWPVSARSSNYPLPSRWKLSNTNCTRVGVHAVRSGTMPQ